MIGAAPPRPTDLFRAEDRMTFVYVERATLSRDSNAITATNDKGTVHIPASAISALLLGPGTRLTHHAVMLLAQSGSTAVWVGEQGVRYYAHGSSLARSTRLLELQAAAVSNRSARLSVARRMYEMRFPDDTTVGLTMQQLRGKEGARVRRIYRQEAQRTGVEWSKRDFDPENFAGGDTINQALSAAHSALYGIVHAVIVSLGCAPGLGFVHTGHYRAFVYDIADLYKAESTIPLAFEVASENPFDVGGVTRRRVRDELRSGRILERCVRDVRNLLDPSHEDDPFYVDVIHLWDEAEGAVAGGVNYAGEVPF